MQSRSAADVRSVRSVHTSSYFARRRSCFLRPRQLPRQACLAVALRGRA